MDGNIISRVEFIWNQLIRENFDKMTFEKFKKREFIIFSAGYDGKALCHILRNENMTIKYFFDNDEKKHGMIFEGIEVKNPNEFLESKDNYIILIANSSNSAQIRKQLNDKFKNDEIYTYQEFLLKFANTSILEIGPLNNPNFIGENVKYFDVLGIEGLRCKAQSWNVDPLGVPQNIDYISESGDLSIVDKSFPIVFSSHVIEHQPNLVEHLIKVEKILRINGRYIMIIPDKRYCYDHYQELTLIEDILDAYYQEAKIHSLKKLLSYLRRTHNNAMNHWKGNHGDLPSFSIEKVKEIIKQYKDSNKQYIDAHAWFFTPDSFKNIIQILNNLGLIHLSLIEVSETAPGQLEFYAILQK